MPRQKRQRRKQKRAKRYNCVPTEGQERAMKFSPEVMKNLGIYVYRLVDPRNGETFYVGKGQKNRVFDHARAALKSTEKEDDVDLKTKLIREIQDAHLSVIPIIHRHGLDKDMALEVEASLIDAYPGLANIRRGHGSSERGCMHVSQVQELYDGPQADFTNLKAIIIKIRQSIVDERGSIYDAVRSAWHIQPDNAEDLPVIACVGGIIRKVYTDVEWHESLEYPGRYEFTAIESTEREHKALLGSHLPPKFRKKGQLNPVLYT